ncbi:MAG: sugar transferase [Bacteroidota bacterium]
MNVVLQEKKGSLLLSGNVRTETISLLEKAGYEVVLINFFKLSGQLVLENAQAELYYISEEEVPITEKLFLMLEETGIYKRRARIIICAGGHTGAGSKLIPFVDDVYDTGVEIEKILRRIKHLELLKESVPASSNYSLPTTFKLPLWKRVFDLMVTSTILIVFSPLFLLVILLIRLDSKGPVFYTSKRVGTGYKTFDFYKFRSMKVQADQLINTLDGLNTYSEPEKGGWEKELIYNPHSVQYISDEGEITEEEVEQEKERKEHNSFFKAKNDPRITRVGRIIRKLSIDEFPQLINVLKGEMSIVGNRPLPLYEAEKLTSDEWAARFFAPAGLTGLWQVNDFAHAKLSIEERKQLDNEYAENFSFWLDMKILLKTLPAMVLHE